jgi:Ca-activated chloride channel family protein
MPQRHKGTKEKMEKKLRVLVPWWLKSRRREMFRIRRINIILAVILVFGFSVSLYSDGFIVVQHQGRIIRPPHPRPVPPPLPHLFPLEVKYHRVNVKIDGQVAVTHIDQVFYNPTGWRLEGYYLFPIPTNAVIKKFSMYVNGKELEAELVDAKKARKIYEDIVRRQRDPALLEYMGRGVFKARIFPIEPHSEKRVKMSYTEVLNKDNQTIEYIYPLNTEKFSAKPLNDVSVNVEIESPENIKTIYCPTHQAEIVRKGDKRAIVGFEEKNTKPDIDFKLYYSTDNKQLGFSLLSYKKENEDGYFFLSLSPGYTSKEDEISEKDITFVLDVSGSMAGEKLKQAKKALRFCVENLNKGDRFEILRFSTEAEALFNGLVAASEKNREKAREFIDDLKAIGGTNIDEALTLALKMENRNGRPYMIIFMTDGKPTIGETDEDTLLKKIKSANISSTRIFTFGIGNDINTHLLDKITEFTRAYRTYIAEKEDIEIKVSNFYSNVQSPILTDIQLDFGRGIRVSKVYPRDLPDLFKGSSLSILGRYQGNGDATIVLTGKVKDKKRTFDFKAKDGFVSGDSSDSQKNDFIPPLWAARRVGYLLDQVRLHGKDKELVDEITQLARTYGIITPYTSYLIVEDERENTRRNIIREQDQTLAQVAGRAPGIHKKNMEEYSGMKAKSGSDSVRASTEVQELNVAENYAQTVQGKSRLTYRDREGRIQNVTAQVKNIQGRAVYNIENNWVDSQIQQQKTQKSKRIQFASSEYFDLIDKEPLSAQFLALGKNVRFVLNDTLYEIYE